MALVLLPGMLNLLQSKQILVYFSAKMAHPSATASWSTSRSSQVADATFREFGACSNLGMGQKMSKPIITKLMLNDYQVIAIFGEINIHQHPFASYLWAPRAAKFRPRLAAVLPPTVGRAAHPRPPRQPGAAFGTNLTDFHRVLDGFG